MIIALASLLFLPLMFFAAALLFGAVANWYLLVLAVPLSFAVGSLLLVLSSRSK